MKSRAKLRRRHLAAVLAVAVFPIGVSAGVSAGALETGPGSAAHPLVPWGPAPASRSTLPSTGPATWSGSSTPQIADLLAPVASANWAGQIDTGTQFNAIGARWTVPTVQPSASPEASATWIGIDGASNTSLIQTGTEQDTSSSTTTYYAWYEILPSAAIPLGPVSPGDQMQASVVQNAPGTWTITIDDLTSDQGASGSVSYSGPGTSAEWIEEAPTTLSGTLETLANFDTVAFSAMSVGGLSPSSSNLTPVDMESAAGNIIAYPGNFNAGTDSLTITFGAPTTTPPAPASSTPPSSPLLGYWLVASDGGVFTYGDAGYYGSAGALALSKPIVGLAATPDGKGYWLVASDGGVFTYGDAGYYGSAGALALSKPIVGLAATPDGKGYWLVASDGGVFTYGDAGYYGSAGALALSKPIVGLAATPDGKGYWLVASDGGVFTYGDAGYYGSAGALALSKPIVGLAATPDGKGYWLVASDGGVFTYGDAGYYGSAGALALSKPIVGLAATPDGKGYWLVASDGGVFTYGDAGYYGSAGALALSKPIVGLAP